MDKSVVQILKHMDMELLNLEIQVAQIKDDPACRGAMIAVETLRKELILLKERLKNN